MNRQKQLIVLALAALVSIAAITLVLSIFDGGVAESDTTVEVDGDTAQVTVNSMGGAEEVIVKSDSDEVTVTEEGETVTLDVQEGSTITVQDQEGTTIEQVYVGSDGETTEPRNIEDSTEWQQVHNGMAGQGTSTNPYIITDVYELQSIKVDPGAHYVLGEDVDAGETQTWNDEGGFQPIAQFSGSLEGQGYSVSNLYINRTDSENVGLFAETDAAVVQNVSFTSVDVTGGDYTGAVAGRLQDSEVSEVTIDGSVTGSNYVGAVAGRTNPTELDAVTITETRVEGTETVGGLVGINNGTISNSVIRDSEVEGETFVGGIVGQGMSEGQVTTSRTANTTTVVGQSNVGGIVGSTSDSSGVSESKFRGTVEGSSNVGGIVGLTDTSEASVVLSSADGTVTGDENIGGIIGQSQSGWIENSYSAGTVQGGQSVGGLIGYQDSGIINTSYSRADVTGDAVTGALAGTVEDASSNGVYWASKESNPSTPVGEGIQFGNELGTSRLTGEAAKVNMSEFNWENVWSPTSDGPVLVDSPNTDESNQQQEEGDSNQSSEDAEPAELTIHLQDQTESDVIGQVTVDEETIGVSGSRTVEVQRNTEYSVQASAKGYTTTEKTVFVEESNTEVTLTVSELSGDAELLVRIQDSDGNDIAGTITAGQQTKTTTEGLASFVVERGDDYVVQVDAPGYNYVEQTVTIDSAVKEMTLTPEEQDESTTQVSVVLRDVQTGDFLDGEVQTESDNFTVTGGIGIFNLTSNETHTVRYVSEGYVPIEEDVVVEDSLKVITKELEPADVSLTVNLVDGETGDDVAGEISVNNEQVFSVDGSRTLAVEKYNEYVIQAASNNYENEETTVSMGDVSKSTTLELTRDTSQLTVNLVDSDGDSLDGSVQIDGEAHKIEEGTTTIPLRVNESHTVVVNSPGYAEQQQVIEIGTEDKEIQFALEELTVGLTVELRDYNGDPMSGQVTIDGESQTVEFGSHTFNVLAESNYELTADASDYVSETREVEIGTQPETATFQLEPEEADLTLQLVDEVTGNSIAGQVTLGDTTRDVDGSTTFTVQKFESYNVTAEATDYTTLTKTITMDRSDKSAIISLEHEKVNLSVRMKSSTGEDLTGTLNIDGTDYGVEGTEVIPVRTNTEVELEANAENYIASTKTLDIGEDDESVEFTLEPDTVDLTIILTDEDTGEDIAADVTIDGDTSIVDGTDTFKVRKNQEVDILVESTDYPTATRTIPVNESEMTEEFTLDHNTVDLSLTLENDVGESVTGEVTIDGDTSSVEGSGVFEVRVNETYDVTASATDHDSTTESVTINESDETETLVLTKHKTELGLTIVDAETGEELSGIVTIDGQDYAISGSRVFELGVNETYTVTGKVVDYHDSTQEITLDETPINRTLELDSVGMFLTVELQDSETNDDINNGTVEVNGNTYDSFTSFELQVNDTYDITLDSPDHHSTTTTVEVGESDKTVSFDLDPVYIDFVVDIVSADTGNSLDGSVTIDEEDGTSDTHSISGSNTIQLRVNQTIDVTADASDYEPTFETIDVGTSNISREYSLTQDTRELTIELRDLETGDALDGEVTLMGTVHSISDSKTFEVAVNDTYTVDASSDGYFDETADITMDESNKTHTFELESTTTELTIELSDVDTGDPLSGNVVFDESVHSISGSQTFTVERYTDYTIDTDVTDYIDESQTVSVSDSPETASFALEPNWTELTIELVDNATGESISGEVTLNDQLYSVNGSKTFTVDRYTNYDITADSSDYFSESTIAEVDNTPVTETISLTPETTTVHVEVEDTDGSPLDGDIIVDGDRTFSVTDGTASVDLKVNTDYDLETDVSGYKPATRSISLGETEQTESFTLDAEDTSMTITVKDEETGADLDAAVSFDGDTYNISGTETFTVAKFADYDVTATATDYESKTVTLSTDDGAVDHTFLLLHDEVDVTVELYDADTGDPINGSLAFDGDTYDITESDTFTLNTNTSYDMTASKTDFHDNDKIVDVGESNKTVPFDMEAKKIDFDVTLEDESDGESLTGDVTFTGPAQTWTETISGSGTVQLRQNSSYDVEIDVTDYDIKTDTLTIGTSNDSKTYQMAPTLTELTINVVDKRVGQGVASNSVTVNFDGRSETISTTETTDADGNTVLVTKDTFQVQVNNDYTIDATAQTYQDGSATVSVNESPTSVTVEMDWVTNNVTIDPIDLFDGSEIPEGGFMMCHPVYGVPIPNEDGTGIKEWVHVDDCTAESINEVHGNIDVNIDWCSCWGFGSWWGGWGWSYSGGGGWGLPGGFHDSGGDYSGSDWKYYFRTVHGNGYYTISSEVATDISHEEQPDTTRRWTTLDITLKNQNTEDPISGTVTMDGLGANYNENVDVYDGTVSYDTSQTFIVTKNTDYEVVASSPDYFDSDPTTISVNDTAVSETIELEPTWTFLTVKIQDNDRGFLIKDSYVTMDGGTEQLPDGEKEFKVNRYSDYDISGDAQHYFASATETVSVSNEPVTEVVSLDPKSVQLTVKLIDDKTGDPLTGEELDLYGSTHTTDSNGEVTLQVKVNDDYTASTNATNYIDKDVDITVGESDTSENIRLEHEKVDLTLQIKDSNGDTIGDSIVKFKGDEYEMNADGLVFTVRTHSSYDAEAIAIGYSDETTSIEVDGSNKTYTFNLDEIVLNGSGTQSDPYEIETAEHLQMMQDDRSAYYELVNDIDATETANYDMGNGFEPIGTASIKFKGALFGNGYSITGLTIDRPNNPASLLGQAEGVTIKQVTFVDPDITGSNAATIANTFDGTMSRVVIRGADGQISGNLNAAGFVLDYSNGSMSDSYSTVSVYGADSASGLVKTQQGDISDVYVAGPVTADDSADAKGLMDLAGDPSIVSDAYWDKDATGQTEGGASGAGTGLTTDQMTGDTASDNMNFDFTETWNETQSYPQVNWAAILVGSGTSSNPFEIENVNHLQRVNDDLSSHYILVSDIDATETATWNDGSGFEPLGDSGSPFLGSFDGQGHTISNLYIDRASTDFVGLFGSSEGPIENVKLTGADVTGRDSVGIVSGETTAGIREVAVDGGSVSGETGVGGVVALTVGSDGTVYDSYSTASVSGTEDVGGLIGNAGTNEVAVDSFSAGTVSGSGGDIGGLIGYTAEPTPSDAVNSAYWDIDASGQADSAAGTGLTTSEMEGSSAETNMNFDFTNTWSTQSGDYPEIEWWVA